MTNMALPGKPAFLFRPSLALALLLLFLATLWISGGASRADQIGQTVIRGISAAIMVLLLLLAEKRPARWGAVPIFLLASVGLVLVQLIPLPPTIWQALPGRRIFLEAAAASGDAQPWRPWAVVPGAAVNAAMSLIVPVTAWFLLKTLRQEERKLVAGLILMLMVASMLLGFLQLTGAGYDNPLISREPGQISGPFANRNHFALFLAIGCLFVAVWAFPEGEAPSWRAPVALGLLVLFPLAILASGSRAGLALGIVALGLALVVTRQNIARALRRYPRWVFPVLIIGMIAAIALLAATTAMSGRGFSIDRVISNDLAQDMRARALPTVWSMARDFFPAGAGFGGFDPLFRIREPFELLKLTYFNHAHNDWLEVVIEGGLPGLLLAGAALGWWGWASFQIWFRYPHGRDMLPRLGSMTLFLVFIASVFDYPARTPMMMAIIVIAAVWLDDGISHTRKSSALRR